MNSNLNLPLNLVLIGNRFPVTVRLNEYSRNNINKIKHGNVNNVISTSAYWYGSHKQAQSHKQPDRIG